MTEQSSASETIAAIATAPGQSAIAVIRVSGSAAKNIAIALSGKCPEHRTATLASFKDQQQNIIDQGLLLYFANPASFTGEDMLELHTHGSSAVLQQLMQRLNALGARSARPGEFSERAYTNGKLDLTQAEAIASLIESRNIAAARVAVKAISGAWAERLHSLDKLLLSTRAQLEAQLDFPEDDVDNAELAKIEENMRELAEFLQGIEQDGFRGQQLQQGMSVVLAGYPNSGKSTLLNAICGKDRAIVTDQPGTTRDLLQEDLAIHGVQISMTDTAGLREAKDVAEQAGIDKTRQAMAEADLLLLITPGDTPEELRQQLAPSSKYIEVRSKTDICGQPPANSPQLGVCAINNEGIAELCSKIVEHAAAKDAEQSALYANTRLANQLAQAKKTLDKAMQQWQQHQRPELLLTDLAEVQQDLAEITGGNDNEQLLGEIFSRFCIGK